MATAQPVPHPVLLVCVILAALSALAASWSPDGKQIAYSFIGGPENIYLANADGSNVIALVESEQRSFLPEWSPDGSHLVFTAMVDGDRISSLETRRCPSRARISRRREKGCRPSYACRWTMGRRPPWSRRSISAR